MSNDNPTFAEIAEENIRQYRKKPLTYEDIKDDPPFVYPEEDIPYEDEL